MNSIDASDRKQNILKYGKYLLIILVIGMVIFFSTKSCNRGYNNIEDDMVEAAKKYITTKRIVVSDERFIELSSLGGIKNTELCSKASGVLVKNENGVLTYTPYLKCDEYTQENKKKYKYITLTGDEIIFLNKGQVYEEQYYTLNGDADVIISGKVGTTPGIYKISYAVYIDNELKETAYRTVIVSNNDVDQNITGLKNKEEPVLILKGDTDIVLKVGQTYREEGWTAYDYTDGKISREVTYDPDPERIDNRKTDRPYLIIYTVKNSKGNIATATRKITYVKNQSDVEVTVKKSTEDLTRSLTIDVSISGNGYSGMELPIKTSERRISYPVTSNGSYKIEVKDIYNNTIRKEVIVDNIDNIPPIGSCTALVVGANTSVEVNASDNKGIGGYKYILDSSETEYMNDSSYRVSKASKSVSVRVKDVVGNEKTLNCEVTIKEEPVAQGRPSGSVTVIDTSEYKLVVTKNDTVEFAKTVDSLNVAQNHPPRYPDYCLSFAYYHAYKLYNGTNLNSMTAAEGASYMYAGKFTSFKNDNKQVVLEKIYELINAGQPVVLHVNGNKAGTSRHYVTVVGYKNSVTSGSTMSEQDLLIIDSHDGKLERMDREGSRFMISGYDTGRTGKNGYGYQLYILR